MYLTTITVNTVSLLALTFTALTTTITASPLTTPLQPIRKRYTLVFAADAFDAEIPIIITQCENIFDGTRRQCITSSPSVELIAPAEPLIVDEEFVFTSQFGTGQQALLAEFQSDAAITLTAPRNGDGGFIIPESSTREGWSIIHGKLAFLESTMVFFACQKYAIPYGNFPLRALEPLNFSTLGAAGCHQKTVLAREVVE